jgi:hypothetical protein
MGNLCVIFFQLDTYARKGELLLVDDGMCRFHLRRDGQLTIYEIYVTRPRCGIGTRILEHLKHIEGARCIVAKCPADLPSTTWWPARGFTKIESTEDTKGRIIHTW